VKVHVSYINSYCGGIRPSLEVEKNLKTPRDMKDFHVLLAPIIKFKVKGDTNEVYLPAKRGIKKVKTDSVGNILLSLKPGKYIIYLTNEVNKKLPVNYNPGCKKMLYAQYGELLIEKGKREYQAEIHFPCNPCEPPRP
jgi:hypothetical protein